MIRGLVALGWTAARIADVAPPPAASLAADVVADVAAPPTADAAPATGLAEPPASSPKFGIVAAADIAPADLAPVAHLAPEKKLAVEVERKPGEASPSRSPPRPRPPALSEAVVSDVLHGAAAALRACPDTSDGWALLSVRVRNGRAKLLAVGVAEPSSCARQAVAALHFPPGAGTFKITARL